MLPYYAHGGHKNVCYSNGIDNELSLLDMSIDPDIYDGIKKRKSDT